VTLVIDISDFGENDLSYGMFTANRDLRQPEAKLGAGGQIVPRRAISPRASIRRNSGRPGRRLYRCSERVDGGLREVVPGSTSPPVALSWFRLKNSKPCAWCRRAFSNPVAAARYAAQYDFGKAFVVTEATPESAAALMQKLKARYPEGNAAATIADEAFLATDKYLGKCASSARDVMSVDTPT